MATSIDQTAICPFPRYRSKHIAENSQWISLTANSFTALLTKREQARFREIVNTCTERRVEKRVQRTAWILSHVLRTTLCEHVNGLCPARWLNEQSITKHWFQSVRTCPYSWATGRNSALNSRDLKWFSLGKATREHCSPKMFANFNVVLYREKPIMVGDTNASERYRKS